MKITNRLQDIDLVNYDYLGEYVFLPRDDVSCVALLSTTASCCSLLNAQVAQVIQVKSNTHQYITQLNKCLHSVFHLKYVLIMAQASSLFRF